MVQAKLSFNTAQTKPRRAGARFVKGFSWRFFLSRVLPSLSCFLDAFFFGFFNQLESVVALELGP